jgi:hypothetical protein
MLLAGVIGLTIGALPISLLTSADVDFHACSLMVCFPPQAAIQRSLSGHPLSRSSGPCATTALAAAFQYAFGSHKMDAPSRPAHYCCYGDAPCDFDLDDTE